MKEFALHDPPWAKCDEASWPARRCYGTALGRRRGVNSEKDQQWRRIWAGASALSAHGRSSVASCSKAEDVMPMSESQVQDTIQAPPDRRSSSGARSLVLELTSRVSVDKL
jgi:hypothetical protein